MADGVAGDALYPLDMDRALAKIKSIKDDSLYWGSGSEAHSMCVNGEVSMGMIWQNRGRNIENDTDGRFKLVNNQALAMPGAYIVPKGNPAGLRLPCSLSQPRKSACAIGAAGLSGHDAVQSCGLWPNPRGPAGLCHHLGQEHRQDRL